MRWMTWRGEAAWAFLLSAVMMLGGLSGVASAQAPLDERATEAVEEIASVTSGLKTLRRIVIDPGHGETNEGAVGVAEVHEKHLTLPLAMHLADRLRAQHPGLEVILTRHSDAGLGLVERAEVANEANADLLISVHLNAAGNVKAAGFETFWVADTLPPMPRDVPKQVALLDMLSTLPERSAERAHSAHAASSFASHVQRQLGERIETLDRKVKRANFTILRYANVPAVVIEFGFLTHAEEGQSLLDPSYQATLVDAVVAAIGAHDAALSAAQPVSERALEGGQPTETQIRF